MIPTAMRAARMSGIALCMKRSFVGKSSNAIFDAELLEKFRRDESSQYGLVGSDLLGKSWKRGNRPVDFGTRELAGFPTTGQVGITFEEFPVTRPNRESDYPTWRDIANDPRSKLITTRMLLSHTAGFNNSRYFDPDHRLVIHFEPGTRYSYGSEGYSLIQLVVETVTKKSTEELMRQHVFGPLGMTRTSMVWQNAFESDHANGYDEYGRSLGIQKRQTAQGAGSMQTTLTDYARLTQAVLFGRGLRKQTHAQMLSAQIPIVSKFEFPPLLPDTTDEYKGIQLSYGLGVGLYHTPHGWAFFKEGHDEGWRTYVVCHQNQATCMVILTNSSNGEGIYSALLRGLLGDTWNPIDWEVLTPYDK